MTRKYLLAAMTAGLLLGAANIANAADTKPAAPKITPGILKALSAAQTANTKKDYPTALAAIEDAKKVANPTPYDSLMIDRFAMSIHVGMNDLDAADVDAEAAADIDPSVIPDADKGGIYRAALQLALRAKHNAKAAQYAKLYAATTPPPPASDQALIAQALYLGGDFSGAASLAQKNIDAATAAGKKPERNDLDVVLAAQVKQKDEAGAEKTLETLVANYNAPEDWDQIMGVALTGKGMRDIDYIYMGRLMLARGGKVSQADANLVGSAANSNRLALYGDADAMQKFGGPAADPREAADKKSMPTQIAAGAKQNGQYNVKAAQAAYGYGMYSDAENLARAAKTKGGVQDPTEPDMVIGMAQTAQGKYADAATTFAGISQSNPASARVVRLWDYYVKSKANPSTAAAGQ
jgi:hypothetical protein